MFRRLCLFAVFIIVVFQVLMPTGIASARTITFARQSVAWNVTVNVCTNGFTVTATGSTPVGTMTAVKVIDASLMLPNDKPPFVRQSRPLAFTSATGSMLVALAGNPKIQVIGTGYFYFPEGIAVGSLVQTTVEGYSDRTPLNIPNGVGTDTVKNCKVPPPAPFVNDLSGVVIDWKEASLNSLAMDGRASPTSGDLMVVYCISSGQFAGTIVINGVDPSGNPSYRLGQVSYNAVVAARGKAISIPAVDQRGELAVSVPKAGLFLAEWTNGNFASYVPKLFSCNMDKNKFNKTADQLKYPDAFGNDGRVAPNPADKVAVYCLINKNQIKIVGIGSDSQGYDLATFNYTDLRAAAPQPLVQKTPDRGTVSLQVDLDDNFFLKWSNGPWGEDQNKGFKCRF